MEQKNLEMLEAELDGRIALLKKSISDSTELLGRLLNIKSIMRKARNKGTIKLHDFSLPSGTLWSDHILACDGTLNFNYGDALKVAKELHLELPSYSDFVELTQYTNVDMASSGFMIGDDSDYYKIAITSMVTASECIDIHSVPYIVQQFSNSPLARFRLVKFEKNFRSFRQLYGEYNTKARLLLVSHNN